MHTRTPWMIGEQNGHCGISIHGPNGLESGQIATVYLNLVTSKAGWGKQHFAMPENAESVANAALIVRAVNSHEALIDALEGALVDDLLPLHCPEWLVKARAALALAKE